MLLGCKSPTKNHNTGYERSTYPVTPCKAQHTVLHICAQQRHGMQKVFVEILVNLAVKVACPERVTSVIGGGLLKVCRPSSWTILMTSQR